MNALPFDLERLERLHYARTHDPMRDRGASSQLPDAVKLDSLPVLRPGVDRLAQRCNECSSALLTAEPPLGGDRFGTVTCSMCGSALAHLTAPLRPITARAAMATSAAPHVLRSAAPVPRSVTKPADWTLDGCGPRCLWPYHHPGEHEAYGRRLALAELTPAPNLPTGCVVTGRLVVDFDTLQARVDGRDVRLSVTEFRILALLARQLGVVVPHEQVIAGAWDHHTWTRYQKANGQRDWAEVHLLRVNVARMRAKLGASSGLIGTTDGVGYWLRAEPPAGDDNAPAPVEQPVLPAPVAAEPAPEKHDDAQLNPCCVCGIESAELDAIGQCDTCASAWRKGRTT